MYLANTDYDKSPKKQGKPLEGNVSLGLHQIFYFGTYREILVPVYKER